jgi:hypothetical protein
MTSLSYDEVFDDFLGRVADFDFSTMDESTANYLMAEYLQKVVSRPYIRRLFKSISADKEIHLIEFEMVDVVDEDADLEFVKTILSKGMVVEWLEPQVRTKVNIAQFFGGKEQKYYSQSNHIAELRALLRDTETELRGEIRDRGYIYNAYLGNLK